MIGAFRFIVVMAVVWVPLLELQAAIQWIFSLVT